MSLRLESAALFYPQVILDLTSAPHRRATNRALAGSLHSLSMLEIENASRPRLAQGRTPGCCVASSAAHAPRNGAIGSLWLWGRPCQPL